MNDLGGEGRVLALDLGSRRVGVAVSDPRRVLASPVTTVTRSRDPDTDRRAIAALVEEWDAAIVLVGLPVSLDGGHGPAAQGVLAEVAALGAVLDVPVVTADERFTTVTADQRLRERGVRGKARTAIVDQEAAVVLLQSWLDGQGSGG